MTGSRAEVAELAAEPFDIVLRDLTLLFWRHVRVYRKEAGLQYRWHLVLRLVENDLEWRCLQ